MDRTACRKIEGEVKEGLIRKLPLPDRGVLYGLPNWPLNEADSKLLIEAMKASTLQTKANADLINAYCNFLNVTEKKHKLEK